MIFNIDRFIVSSTGKGDGTDKVTSEELLQSLPRLLMAGIIGVCISAPLEIRILKPEIDAQLELEQNKYLAELNGHAEKLVQARKDELLSKLDKAQRSSNSAASTSKSAGSKSTSSAGSWSSKPRARQAAATQVAVPPGRTRKTRSTSWKQSLPQTARRMARSRRFSRARSMSSKAAIAALTTSSRTPRPATCDQSRHLDGLMKRIHISHEIGGFVPWAILLCCSPSRPVPSSSR